MKRPVAVISRRVPYLTFLFYRIKLWFIKCALRLYLRYSKYNEKKLPANQRPTFTRSYAPLPKQEARIFIPPTYKPGDAPLPLLIDVHGGGFCLGAPILDDPDNATLAYTHGLCVVSIPYRLGPEVKHPGAVNDVAAMIGAVLDDKSLPVDFSRVALIGYSAGGNLALSAPQFASLRGRIKAVVACYPAVNNSLTLLQRSAKQKYHPSGKDYLHAMVGMFNAGYIAPGTDRTDPLLSPIYAERKDLPLKVFIIGCEWDMLCPEAEEMAEDLATHEEGEKTPLAAGRDGWKKGNLQWELIPETEHGFNQMRKKGPEGVVYQGKSKAMHAGVAEWLKREVYDN
jgi:acetyl esterase/lipase